MIRHASPAAPALALGPDSLFGDLFVAVQSRRLFGDSKTFPDMEPRSAPAEIMSAWHATVPKSDEAVRAFVAANFDPPPAPRLVQPEQQTTMAEYIATLWDDLIVTPQAHSKWSSALDLPSPYVIPGGRFRELYYWDSYFTMLGLAVDRRHALIESMLDNFVSLIERYGHIPNGTRSYFLSRSQPPFFVLMTDLSRDAAPAVRRRRLAALRREYAYWMTGEDEHLGPGAASHVVRLADGAVLNRYWDRLDTPRPESYVEDVRVASNADRPAGEIYRDLRAAAESGWDFSSRWLRDPANLATIETSAIVPVDLNCLLYVSECRIAEECASLGDTCGALVFQGRAEARAAAINTYFWIEAEGRFADWHWVEGRPMANTTAASLYPLFVGVASADQAAAMAAKVERDLLAPSGLRTTTIETNQQWDQPNGWAPLQWIAVAGLRRYGHHTLADTIAERWLTTVQDVYDATGALFEKYNIEQARPAGGGEYPNQQGFGWTNGVVRALLAEREKRRP